MKKINEILNKLSIKARVTVGVIVVLIVSLLFTNIFWRISFIGEVERQFIDKARSICTMGEAMREYMADNWERQLYDTDYLKKD
nr:hypothetical protein [Spirochaetota bacterium]